MNRPAPAIILALLLCCALCEPALSQTAPNKNGDASVSGRVTIKGNPAPGIVVGLRLSHSSPLSDSALKATTDEDGRYRIINVPAGIYQVKPATLAFVNSDSNKAGQSLVINDGDNVTGMDFDLIRGGVITGKVTDADGHPVVEESVRLVAATYPRSGGPDVPKDFQTDDRGIYRIFGIRPGRYKVSIGYESLAALRGVGTGRTLPITFYPDVSEAAKATIVEVGEGTEATNIDITLAPAPRTYSVSGRVVDGETGKPVTNAPISLMKVMIIDAHGTSSYGGGTEVRTKADGEFTLDRLPAGKYTVSVEARQDSNLRAEVIGFDIVDQDVTGIVVKTITGPSLSGSVVLEQPRDRDNAGAPPAWLSVYWQSESAGSSYSSSQSTQIRSDGSFYIGGLSRGTVGFSVGAWSQFGDARPIPILRVERDGVPQPNGIQIQDGEHVTGIRVIAAYSSGSIRGAVKFENGTLPADGQLFISLKKVGDNSPNGGGAQADARGRFLIEALATGTYELTVSAFVPEWGARRQTKQLVTVTDGAASDVLVTIDLTPPKGR